MKKQIATFALVVAGATAFAQDLTSKKGELILPEKGDWSIGIDANPFLNYVGNFFGKSASNTAPTFNFLGNQVITGKYFLDAKTALRAGVRIGFSGATQRNTVADRSAAAPVYPATASTVENKYKNSNTNVGISFGIEKRKGKTRLQGYYGAEAGIFLSGSKDKFTYGNALNPTATQPVNVDPSADAFSGTGNIQSPNTSGVVGSGRITDRKNGTVFSFGARAFIGVEYFILPKISLGGEFGWGLGLSTGGKTTTTIESVGVPAGTTTQIVGSTKETGAKQGAFHLDTDNTNSFFGASAALKLNFYF